MNVVASLVLSVWLSDHMMLPANRPVPLSGRAAPGAVITVEFADQKKTAVADSSSHWEVILDPMPASRESRVLKISCNHQSAISNRQFVDVLIGDIWLCSGQSNMQLQVKDSDEAAEAVADIQNADVRCFDGCRWVVITPENVRQISAVGAYFAMEMARRQKAPVGIFVAARGGTGIEAWVPVEAFPDTDDGSRFKPLVNNPDVLKAAEEDAADFQPYGKHRLYKWRLGRAVPSSLYETLIRPFGDLPVCGVVWYQGESNASNVERAQEYRLWLQRLIGVYRSLWRNPNMPFVIIQLPDYDSGSDSGRAGWARLQHEQASVAESTANAVLVDIKDLGDLKDIHPRRKREVGVRAAEAAWKLLGK
jgi:sialate O-acetylesterase